MIEVSDELIVRTKKKSIIKIFGYQYCVFDLYNTTWYVKLVDTKNRITSDEYKLNGSVFRCPKKASEGIIQYDNNFAILKNKSVMILNKKILNYTIPSGYKNILIRENITVVIYDNFIIMLKNHEHSLMKFLNVEKYLKVFNDSIIMIVDNQIILWDGTDFENLFEIDSMEGIKIICDKNMIIKNQGLFSCSRIIE